MLYLSFALPPDSWKLRLTPILYSENSDTVCSMCVYDQAYRTSNIKKILIILFWKLSVRDIVNLAELPSIISRKYNQLLIA